MGRHISLELRSHLQSTMQTTCYLLKVIPRDPSYPAYGVTDLDRDVVYDDGGGEMTYLAAIGMQPAAILTGADLAVDNSELPSLLPEFDVPISEADIRAGAYDYARFVYMRVNYQDLSQGHVTIHAGTIGQVTIRSDGLSFVNELRGLAAQLKQSVCAKDSLTCRAIHGSQPPGSSTPGPQVERDWCGFDAAGELVTATVTAVGLETTRAFAVTPDGSWATDHLAPGIAVWLTGSNAGRTREIESNTAGGGIELAFETPFPIQVGDTLQYRPDCTKQARDTAKGCKRWFGNEWVLHFRGEPDIPIGDAAAMATPGASSGPGQGGRTTEPAADPA